MATQLANAYVQIIPSAEGIKGKLTNLLSNEASEAGDKAGKVAGNSLAGTIKKVVGAAGIGAAAIGTALSAMTKQAISAYGNYEQLVGGVETLFEDMSADVIANSKNAYMTAGLSANEYMETVMGFSASLNQSLKASDGNIARSAEISNQIITDMSDNANKMGSSMESIQNAYSGFAKQNYTMLDNLKLGYGGTKSEMERLLADAGKLAGTKFDIDSFADVAEAIHVIQTEVGITGTTSKEAASTIQGSLGMLKGAWTNFMTGMADPEQDFGMLLNNVIDSALTVVDNIAPRLVETIPRLTEGLVKLVQNMIPHIGPILEELLPTLITGTTNLVIMLAQNFPSMLRTVGSVLLSSVQTIFSGIWDSLSDKTKERLTRIAKIFEPLWNGCKEMWENVGKPIFDEIVSIIGNAATWFDENFDSICATFENGLNSILGAWDTLGKPLFDLIVEIVTLTKDAFEEKFGSISDVVGNVFSEVSSFWNEHLKPCFEAIRNWLVDVLFPIFSFVFEKSILPMIQDCFEGIGRFWDNSLKPILTGIIDFITGVFSGDWDKAFSGLMNIAEGLLNGLIDIFTVPFDKAKRIVSNAIETIKGYFKFEWSLPQLKLPHFKVSGGEAPWGFGGKGSLPSVGIDWYSKAMNNPMLMNSPTAFGINSLGQIMAGGESGSEVVSGTETLMKMIAAAVASQNGNLVELMDEGMDKIIALLRYLPQLANMQIVTDTGTLIGELAPGMDEALGKMAEG